MARLTVGPVTVVKHELISANMMANIELSPKARHKSGFVPSLSEKCLRRFVVLRVEDTFSFRAFEKLSCRSTSGVLNVLFIPVFVVQPDTCPAGITLCQAFLPCGIRFRKQNAVFRTRPQNARNER